MNKKTIDKSESQVYNKHTSESGHWYTQEGEPMYTIIGVNGKERNTNLRDARLLGLVPSVTTIMDLIAKPSLENWKINQALNSALTLNRGNFRKKRKSIRERRRRVRRIFYLQMQTGC